jgi:hypothetical protein
MTITRSGSIRPWPVRRFSGTLKVPQRSSSSMPGTRQGCSSSLTGLEATPAAPAVMEEVAQPLSSSASATTDARAVDSKELPDVILLPSQLPVFRALYWQAGDWAT